MIFSVTRILVTGFILGLVSLTLSSTPIYGQVYMSEPSIRNGFEGSDITDSLTQGAMVEYVRGTITNDNFFSVNVPYSFRLDGVIVYEGNSSVPARTSGVITSRLIPAVSVSAGAHAISMKDSAGVGPSRNFTVGGNPRPTVTITFTDSTASEAGFNSGGFAIYRSGSTATALTVRYSVSGTAIAGMDFSAIGSQLTIPAGQTSATLIIAPLDDSFVEGNETVTVSISANASYTIGSPATRTVTITDNDTSSGVVTFSGDTVSVTFSGLQPGANYTVQRTYNLYDWTSLTQVNSVNPVFSEAKPPGQTKVFYRLRR